MKWCLRATAVELIAVTAVLLVCCVGSAAARDRHPRFQGSRLEEALRTLQRSGLQIVFSSEIVTPDMVVASEPRAATSRGQLDELLEPHGLKAQPGPGNVLQIIRARPSRSPGSVGSAAKKAARTRSDIHPAVESYVDRVTVRGMGRDGIVRDSASDLTLGIDQLQPNRGMLEDDAMQAARMMPAVTAADDFRSEFSVRGSPYRQIGIVVEGVATPWLTHHVYGHSDVGSLSMLGVDNVDSATLRTGAYPQRYGDVLGAELELSLREGSRESRRFTGSLGGTSAAFAAEGPIGLAKRGSWIVSARNSYLDWPIRPHTQTDPPFSFADAYAKIVVDLTPRHQLAFAALGGRSTIDGADDPIPGALSAGLNQAALFNGSWRTTLGARGAIRQRIAVVAQDSSNTQQEGRHAGQARNRELSYRSELFHTLFGGRLEAGGELRWMQGAREFASDSLPAGASSEDAVNALTADWSMRSAYAHFDRIIGRGVSVAGGLRLSSSSLGHHQALSRWILADWTFKPGWTLTTSAGVSHQLPDLDQLQNIGVESSSTLRPETATNVSAAIQQRFARSFRWQATVFHRIEYDVLRAPALTPRLSGNVEVDVSAGDRYENALRGKAGGVELLFGRDSGTRLSGWVSYAYGSTRQTDTTTSESFWSDFDRRHSVSASAIYRVRPRTTIAVALRSTTNTPIPGYFSWRDGGVYIGERRNEVRLPPYARLDARLQRTFFSSRPRLTLFAEVLNVLNRENQGLANGIIDRSTGQAVGFTRPMLARRASAGLVVGF